MAKKTWFVGQQFSPFFNEAAPGTAHQRGWNVDWKLRNTALPGYSFVLSGDAEAGLVPMIREFGFFEGGLDGSNKYRLDPRLWHALRTGSVSPEAAAYQALRLAHRRRRWEEEKRRLEAEVDPSESDEAAAFFRSQMDKIEKKLAKFITS